MRLENEIEVLKLKQKSPKMTPTTIEKTRHPHQLFEATNPLWMTERYR